MRLLTVERLSEGKASETAKYKLSDRAKGIFQGIVMFPVLFGVFAMLIVIYDNLDADRMDATYSALTLIGLISLARIIYAIIFEAGKKEQSKELQESRLFQLLPPSRTIIDGVETIRQKTGELFQGSSITEQATQPISKNTN